MNGLPDLVSSFKSTLDSLYISLILSTFHGFNLFLSSSKVRRARQANDIIDSFNVKWSYLMTREDIN